MAALALAACHQAKQPKQPETAVASPAAKAAPAGKPGITVAEARLVLPAVVGNPGAAYFQVDNSAGANIAIASVAIDGVEKAEMHQTNGETMAKVDSVEIAPSTSIKFEPGKLHVMAFNLAPTLKAGGSTDMTLVFEDGEKETVPLKIEPAGGADAMGAMH